VTLYMKPRTWAP
ncbi:hypothetical protein IOCL1545_000189600, partial [Leishmania shawi]